MLSKRENALAALRGEKPDYFTYLDDYAHAGGLMISTEIFRNEHDI